MGTKLTIVVAIAVVSAGATSMAAPSMTARLFRLPLFSTTAR
jgi:hypothetical protein